MADSSSVDVILEFLRRNNFTRAEAALRSELTNRPDLYGVLQKLMLEDKGLSMLLNEANGGKPAVRKSGINYQGSEELLNVLSSRKNCEVSEELIVKEIECGTERNGSENKWKNISNMGEKSKTDRSVGTSDKNFTFSKGSDDVLLDLYSWKYRHGNGSTVSYQDDVGSASANNFPVFQVSQKSKVSLGEVSDWGRSNAKSGEERHLF